jgi:hypothetical protein
MAYVYRHIRLDKNQPFYIGIGKDDKLKRAFDKTRRNNFWRNIVSKTDYEIEILLDGLTWDKACDKEKEFIFLYGRKDLGTGTLVNLTNGGEGTIGISDDAKRKRSERMKGKKNALGSKRAEELKKMQSEMMKGKKYALGKKRTEETKQRISETMSNRYWEKLYDEEFDNAKRLGFAR